MALVFLFMILFGSVGLVVAAEMTYDKLEVDVYINGFKEEKIHVSKDLTKEEILEEADIIIEREDRLVKEHDEEEGYAKIIVDQFRKETIESIEPLPYETEKKATSELKKGEEKVVEKGRDGYQIERMELSYLGEKLTNKEVIDTKEVAPDPKIIKVGTREEPETEIIEQGTASWYGSKFHGRRTSSGEAYNMNALTAAHPELPFGSEVKVVSVATGKSVNVRINDRGPHIGGRIIDLSKRAAEEIGLRSRGLGEVKVKRINN